MSDFWPSIVDFVHAERPLLDACDAVEADTFRFDLRSLDEHLPDGAVTLALGEHEVEYEPSR